MNQFHIMKMFLKVILPPILVIALFGIAIGAIIIPATEDALMQKKQDTIKAIVMSATSILEKHAQMEQDGLVSKEDSQLAALAEMRALRYGHMNKDYLWITDLQPKMVMHPYFPELEGTLLDKYADPEGYLIFIEAAKIARMNSSGYLHYMWPRQDNTQDIVPKLSYIQLFKPWGWVVGSGIYLDDVRAEIRGVSYRMLQISGWIGLIVALLSIFIIRQGLKSEKGRRHAEMELLSSHERYQALAHASGEMVLLTINGNIAGANKKACEILGKNENEIITKSIKDFVLDASGQELISSAEAGENFTTAEIILQGKSSPIRVLISAEHTVVNSSPAIMFAGYSIHSNPMPNIGYITEECLRKSDTGTLILDSINHPKIINADVTATSILAGISEKSVMGIDFRSLLNKGDSSRLFLQLKTDKKAVNMLVRPAKTLGEKGFFKLNAAIIEESMEDIGHVAIVIQDATNTYRSNRVMEDLLAELLSPDKKIWQEAEDQTMKPTEVSLREQFIRSQLILRQSVKMGLRVEKHIESATLSINRIFISAIQKAIDSMGPPPCRYALLAFGSIGRSEPTFNADQDTALIFEASENDEVNYKYFTALGESVTSLCANAGIPPCNAGNTAANPEWSMNSTAWERKFSSWIKASQPDDLIKVNIFFDFRVLSGDHNLASVLRSHVFQEVAKHPAFLFNLAQDILCFRLPTDIFGRIQPDSRSSNHVNLKGTMMHFVNFTRIYALRNAIDETNTLRRLTRLIEESHIPSDTGEDTIEAWKFLLQLRLENQVSAMEMNFPQENTLIIEDLNSWEQAMLKKAFSQVKNLQKRLTIDFTRVG